MKGQEKPRELKRTLGFIMLRGEHILMVRWPPMGPRQPRDGSEDQEKKLSNRGEQSNSVRARLPPLLVGLRLVLSSLPCTDYYRRWSVT